MRFLFVILFAFFSFLGQAQNQQVANQTDLYFYSDVMINAESYSNRLRAHQKFTTLFAETLKDPKAWEMNLEEIPFIHSVVSPDSLFKIYTYYIADEKNSTQENGFIHMKTGEVFELNPTDYLDDIEYNENEYTDWLSGIYYHMIPFKHKN